MLSCYSIIILLMKGELMHDLMTDVVCVIDHVTSTARLFRHHRPYARYSDDATRCDTVLALRPLPLISSQTRQVQANQK